MSIHTGPAIHARKRPRKNYRSHRPSLSMHRSFRVHCTDLIGQPDIDCEGLKFWLFFAFVQQVDRVGRRPFLLWGAVAAMSSVLLLSLSFAVSSPGLSFAACCGLVAAYAVSFGPVTWLITAEMFPAGIRGRALGIGQVKHIHDVGWCWTLLSETASSVRDGCLLIKLPSNRQSCLITTLLQLQMLELTSVIEMTRVPFHGCP